MQLRTLGPAGPEARPRKQSQGGLHSQVAGVGLVQGARLESVQVDDVQLAGTALLQHAMAAAHHPSPQTNQTPPQRPRIAHET